MTFPFHLPKDPGQTRIFYAAGANWQPYSVPVGATMLHMVAIGSGGNGASGHSAAAGTARGGGGGGGSGAITCLSIPTAFLPQTLWVRVPNLGASYVAVQPDTAVANTLILANSGGNAGVGTATAGGPAGSGGAATTLANRGPYASLGMYRTIAGQNGVIGGAQTGAVGTAVVFGAVGLFLSAGAGGAGVGTTGTQFAGGAITGSGLVPTIAGGLAGSNPGEHGLQRWSPVTFTGGAGGGSSNAGTGGAGGIPGPGCGGGGGGGGVTGGAGAVGGPGLVMISYVF